MDIIDYEVIFMCGRYSVMAEEDSAEMEAVIREINRKINAGVLGGVSSGAPINYAVKEVFPTNFAPILMPGKTGHFKPTLMKWGFPRWDGKGVVINARSETILDKPMFRKPFSSCRCIVPASGFYEWKKHDDSSKTKYYFQLSDKSLMNMAGIWNSYRQPDGSIVDTFVILTTQANEDMAPFHDRMPVILVGDEREAWLRDLSASQQILESRRPRLIMRSAG